MKLPNGNCVYVYTALSAEQAKEWLGQEGCFASTPRNLVKQIKGKRYFKLVRVKGARWCNRFVTDYAAFSFFVPKTFVEGTQEIFQMSEQELEKVYEYVQDNVKDIEMKTRMAKVLALLLVKEDL